VDSNSLGWEIGFIEVWRKVFANMAAVQRNNRAYSNVVREFCKSAGV